MKLFSRTPKTPEEILAKQHYKAKKARLMSAKQDELYRAPNPRGGLQFPEEDFLDFKVFQESQMIKLQTYRFQPKTDPIAIVFMFHGLNAWSGHSAHVAKALTDIGCLVVAFDHRGFGKSEGIKGLLDLPTHLADSQQFVDRVEDIYGKNIPKFLAGLSMGGMTSYRLSLEKPERYAGTILIAPAIQGLYNSTVKSLAKFMSKIAPQWNFREIKKDVCHKNPQAMEEILQDPYVYSTKMCGQTIHNILEGMMLASQTFENYRCPFLIIQGGLDKCVDPDVGFGLIRRSPVAEKDKAHLYYENMWHDVYHEPEIVDIIPKIVSWVRGRLNLTSESKEYQSQFKME